MKYKAREITIILSLILFAAPMAHARLFKNSYIQFEIPDNWTCVIANTEWICNPSGKSESREAVLILAAKVAGPEDNFEAFQHNLSTPHSIQNRTGALTQSKVLQIKEAQIQGQKWLESLHLDSEIEDFYTRYLVTVKQNLSILISLSCQKSAFTKYSNIFTHLLPTIKIIAANETLQKPLPALTKQPQHLAPVATAIPEEPHGPERKPVLFWLLIGLTVLVFTLFILALRGDRRKKRRRP